MHVAEAQVDSELLRLVERLRQLRKPTGALGGGDFGRYADAPHTPGRPIISADALRRVLEFDPFWSRNRLTFLHYARYHRHARSWHFGWGNPYERLSERSLDFIMLAQHPVLIAGSSEAALMRASRTVKAPDFGSVMRSRVWAEKRLEPADRHLGVWIELDGDMRRGIRCQICGRSIATADGRYPQSSRHAALLDQLYGEVDDHVRSNVDRCRRR